MKISLVAKLPTGAIQLSFETPDNVVQGPAPRNETERAAQDWMNASMNSNPFMKAAMMPKPPNILIISEEEYHDLQSPGVGGTVEISITLPNEA